MLLRVKCILRLLGRRRLPEERVRVAEPRELVPPHVVEDEPGVVGGRGVGKGHPAEALVKVLALPRVGLCEGKKGVCVQKRMCTYV